VGQGLGGKGLAFLGSGFHGLQGNTGHFGTFLRSGARRWAGFFTGMKMASEDASDSIFSPVSLEFSGFPNNNS
ncbi:MAG: hypothetical protein RSC66_12770, partial [Comamonas sp.]